MKKIYYSSFLLILLTAISCEKPLIKTGNVNGVVKDATTGEPIANADVFLLQNEIGDAVIIGGGGPSTQIDFTTTDANGNFSFVFNYDKNYRYLCGAEKELYFDLDQEFSVDEDIKDGDNVEVLLNPVAWLSLHVKAVNDYEHSDFISIQDIYGDPYYGGDIDTTILLSVQGNTTYHLVWFIYIDGLNDGSESSDIYCPSFDTTFAEILY